MKRKAVPLVPPHVTFGLIGVTAIVFLLEISMPPGGRQGWILAWGAVPAELASLPTSAPPAAALTLLTSQLLHLGWFHFLWNALALVAVGPAVERKLGSLPFAAVYIVSGIGGILAQLLAGGPSEIPLLGATSSVAGILGSYAVSHWADQVSLRLPFTDALWRFSIWVLIGVWGLGQFLVGLFSAVPPRFATAPSVWMIAGGLGVGVLMAWPLIWSAARRQARVASRVHRYNPYDNPDEEYRPLREPRTREPFDDDQDE